MYIIVVDDYFDLANATEQIISSLIEEKIESINLEPEKYPLDVTNSKDYFSQIEVKSYVSPQKALQFINENLNHILMVVSDNDMPEIMGVELLLTVFNQTKDFSDPPQLAIYSTSISKILSAYEDHLQFCQKIIRLKKPCGLADFRKVLDKYIFRLGSEQELCLID